MIIYCESVEERHPETYALYAWARDELANGSRIKASKLFKIAQKMEVTWHGKCSQAC